MKNFLRTVLVQNRTEGSDRTFQEDLPVNPLSAVVVTMRGDINTVDTDEPLADFYGCIPSLGIMYRGQDIVRGSLRDLAVLNAMVTGITPFGNKPQDAAAETWALTVMICLGRAPYNSMECFPAVKRGDLRLEVVVDTLVNDVDLVELQIETIELLDAQPANYIKYTTGGITFASTGQENVRLPIGNPLLGVLLFGTTVPTAAVQTATWEQMRTKIDNVEQFYAKMNWDSAQGESQRRIKGSLDFLSQHAHRYNGAAAAFASTLGPIRPSATGLLEQYAYLDFDPMGDGEYMLETAGRADVVIQRDSGTADAGRYLPVELVAIAGAA
jgi:hypothetical protein